MSRVPYSLITIVTFNRRSRAIVYMYHWDLGLSKSYCPSGLDVCFQVCEGGGGVGGNRGRGNVSQYKICEYS